jgi:hypothetical protein
MTEQGQFTSGRPILCGYNVLRAAVTSGSLKWVSARNSSTDITASGRPTSRLCDGYSHLTSTPASSASSRYLAIDLGGLYEFDTLVILNHGTDTENSNITVSVSDSALYSGNPTQILTLAPHNPITDKRRGNYYWDTGMGPDLKRFTAQYIWVGWTSVMAGTVQPVIGEVFLGRRYQLKHAPEMAGWDPAHLVSSAEDFKSASGITTRYVRYAGQRVWEPVFAPSDTSYIADILSFWADCDYGTEPFLFNDNAYSAPDDTYFMLADPELTGPLDGPFQRRFSLKGAEQGPYFLTGGL